jgi:hypothetical protein
MSCLGSSLLWIPHKATALRSNSSTLYQITSYHRPIKVFFIIYRIILQGCVNFLNSIVGRFYNSLPRLYVVFQADHTHEGRK